MYRGVIIEGYADGAANGPDAAAGASATADAQSEAVTRDPTLLALLERTRRAARGSAPLLILGETGAGKELVARYAHEHSPRRDSVLRVVNCAAIPSALVESTLFGHEKGAFTGATRRVTGAFEAAHGSTVFLDEIGELALPAQAALLRVLESKRITRVGSAVEIALDVRVIAATHRDLDVMVAEGTFRADLLHRLDVIALRVPPLRDRPEDLEPLVHHFLKRCASDSGRDTAVLAPDAWRALRAYPWPGNVRELRNTIEYATMAGDGATITLDDLPERVLRVTMRPVAEIAPSGALCRSNCAEPIDPQCADNFAARVRAYEVGLIQEALAHTGGNRTRAAARLGMPLRTLVHKIRVFGLRNAD